MLRDPAAEERKAGAEDQACVDLCGRRDDALVEKVRALVSERLEDPLVELVDARTVVARSSVGELTRSERLERRREREPVGEGVVSVWSTWFATRGPTIASSAEGGIGRPSRSAASSVSSNVLPRSIACISTEDCRVSRRLTTNAGASLDEHPALPEPLGDVPGGRDRDVVGEWGADELDERQHGDRVEEVHAHDALGVLEAGPPSR